MKFGGTSVADAVKIRAAAQKAIDEHNRGNQVVVVVSAMGKATDHLEKLALEVTPNPPAREKDLLLSIGEQQTVALMSMAIDDLGGKPYGVSGNQLGIETDSKHNRARILSINTKRICGELEKGKIVVAAGFQGIDKDNNITTLGRGGSDTTAVALAASLGARCDIYTDVDGVYTTDPRIVTKARKLERISYEEMLEMASLGAKVLQTRSVEAAMIHRVPLRVRSSFDDPETVDVSGNNIPGTLVCDEDEIVEQEVVSGIAYSRNEAKVTLARVRDKPGVSARIFGPLSESEINVDMIVQNVSGDGKYTDLTFTVSENDLDRALKVIEEAKDEIEYEDLTGSTEVVKVSVIGIGMRSHAGVAAKMFRTLADRNINIQAITTSEIKISVLIDSAYTELALRSLHTAYGLDAEA